ncbi:hypothetical protein LSM04_005511 [Trypanosoma melophagium]|uniref:uncharacterized protein n=1 Tax=Trypanosoma melophagium TaxID=715481 RepID=UPI00351A49ED|nr:hypothetical protein LSM04_005511 [Trypanosoma melophagium]
MWKLAIITTIRRRTGSDGGMIVALMPRETIIPVLFTRRFLNTSRTTTTTTTATSGPNRNSATVGINSSSNHSSHNSSTHSSNSNNNSSYRMGQQRPVHRRNSKEQTVKVATQSSKSSASGTTMRRSRFYRIVMEHGFGFAIYLYILGESITLAVLYVLHSNIFSTGDSFSWMRYIGCDRLLDLDRWSQTGPVISGLCFSPRLLLNYLIANIITYPFYSLQVKFCLATFPLLCTVLSPVNYMLLRFKQIGKRNKKRIPKAPSAKLKPRGSLTQ